MAARSLFLLLMVVIAMTSGICFADNNKNSKDPVNRLLQKLRQVEQQKSQLMLEKERLVQEKAATDDQLKDTREKLAAVQRKANGMSEQAGTLEKALANTNADRDVLKVKLEDTIVKLRETEAEKRRLETVGAKQQKIIEGQKGTIGVCASNNARLFQYGSDLLDKYRSKSCSDAILQAEPFTRLKHVEVENMVEDYRDKLSEQRFPTEERTVVPAGESSEPINP